MTSDELRSPCPLACSLDLFGDRWSLLILRDMMVGGKQRYKEFLASPEGISTNILAARLKVLAQNGFIERHADPNDKKSAVYLLTERGISLLPVVVAILEWAVEHDERSQMVPSVVQAIKKFGREVYLEKAAAALLEQRQIQLAALQA